MKRWVSTVSFMVSGVLAISDKLPDQLRWLPMACIDANDWFFGSLFPHSRFSKSKCWINNSSFLGPISE
jgi:hypothetical protein